MKRFLELLAELDSLELRALEAVMDRLQREGAAGPVDYEAVIDEITSLPRERLHELAAPKAEVKSEDDPLVLARVYQLSLDATDFDYDAALRQARREAARGELKPKPASSTSPKRPRRQGRVVREKATSTRPSPLPEDDTPPQPARSGGKRHADEGPEGDQERHRPVIGGAILAGGRSSVVRLDGELAWFKGRGSR